jgi:hypothetical protein
MHLHEYMTHNVWGAKIGNEFRRRERIGGFLSRGAAGGAVAGFVWTAWVILVQHHEFLVGVAVIFLLPYMLVSGLIGSFVGAGVWLARRFINFGHGIRLTTLLAALSVGVIIQLSCELELHAPVDRSPLMLLVWGLLLIWFAAFTATRRIKPFKVLVFGSGLQSAWQLTGVFLRVASVFILMEAILILELVLFVIDEKGLPIMIYLVFYCSVSAFIALRNINLPTTSILGFFINLPILLRIIGGTVETSLSNLVSTNAHSVIAGPDPTAAVCRLILFFFLPLWVIFIVGRVFDHGTVRDRNRSIQFRNATHPTRPRTVLGPYRTPY